MCAESSMSGTFNTSLLNVESGINIGFVCSTCTTRKSLSVLSATTMKATKGAF